MRSLQTQAAEALRGDKSGARIYCRPVGFDFSPKRGRTAPENVPRIDNSNRRR